MSNAYLKKLKEIILPFLKKPTFLVLLFCISQWLILPHISNSDDYSFVSRYIQFFLIGIIIIYKFKNQLKGMEMVSIVTKLTEFLKKHWNAITLGKPLLWFKFITYIKNYKAKCIKVKYNRRLNRLPWYMFIGTPLSGKETLITNFNLYFSHPKHFGEDAEGYVRKFHEYAWWFSEQAVLIEAPNNIKESNFKSFKSYLKMLKKARKNRPISGIILTFSLVDVVLYSNQERQAFIQNVCQYIRELHQKFKSKIPVYLIFTKADLVEGFIEFFNNLNEEEIRQVWGVTFPIEICTDLNKVKKFYNAEYSAIIERLRSRVLWLLDSEKNPQRRELIHCFPQQMQLLRKPIETFINELFIGVRLHNSLQFRGLYFSSSRQEGKPYNFIYKALSMKFQLTMPMTQHLQCIEERYFVSHLFNEIIYPEVQLLGGSERYLKIKKISYYAVRIIVSALAILIVIGIHTGYKSTIQKIKGIQEKVEKFKKIYSSLSLNSDSLSKMLPALNQLNEARLIYKKNFPLGMNMLFSTIYIRRHLNYAMQRALNNLFIPKVAAKIEDNLNKQNLDDNQLYSVFKGYLAFSSLSSIKKAEIKAPMEYYWRIEFSNKPNIIKQLLFFLNLSLLEKLTKLPLDGQLISRIRSKLELVDLSKRAYGLLQMKAKNSGFPKLFISSAVGSKFYHVFTANHAQLTIPFLYTSIGFDKIFLQNYRSIAQEVSQDNVDIGLISNALKANTALKIENSLQQTYQQLYEKHWNSALVSIKIKPFTNLKQSILTLKLIVSKKSPMKKFFAIVYKNTVDVNTNKINVSAYYRNLNKFQMKSHGYSWLMIQKVLINLKKYLKIIQQTPDQNKAEYYAVLKTIGTGKSPIIDLIATGKKVPYPINRWLEAIAHNIWQVLINGAHSEVNMAWEANVMQEYKTNIQNHYPVNPNSKTQISIKDFNHFYGFDGTLNTFFNQYIKPFVRMNQNNWKLYKINGLSFQLSSKDLALFHHVTKIQNQYFPNKSPRAGLTFYIKPIMLDANASSSSLIIGNQSINYQHGPQTITMINWPFTDDSQFAQVTISTFNHNQYTETMNGPWAFFKMINRGNFVEHNLGSYIFSVKMHGYLSEYEFSGLSEMSTYKLTFLKNFNLPDQIAK